MGMIKRTWRSVLGGVSSALRSSVLAPVFFSAIFAKAKVRLYIAQANAIKQLGDS